MDAREYQLRKLLEDLQKRVQVLERIVEHMRPDLWDEMEEEVTRGMELD